MLTQLKIRNYRGFRDLAMDSLKAINLIAGKNNTGKTSLLEAVFLLSGEGDSQMMLNPNVIRGLEPGSTKGEAVKIFWKHLFFGLNMEQSIEIQGNHPKHGPLALKITPDRQSTTNLDSAERISATNQMDNLSLVLQFQCDGKLFECRISQKGEGFEGQHPLVRQLSAAILLPQKRTDQEDAHRLGKLKQKKQGDVVLEALRIIEPKLKSIEENSSSGTNLIWGDIGLSELVPLATMGEGMNRIARIVSIMASVPEGSVVLIDEIENGLHHSILPDIWRHIDKVAQKFDTQIIATTHSRECVRATRRASLDPERFRYHRLEVGEEGNYRVTYDPEVLESAFEHNFEIR